MDAVPFSYSDFSDTIGQTSLSSDDPLDGPPLCDRIQPMSGHNWWLTKSDVKIRRVHHQSVPYERRECLKNGNGLRGKKWFWLALESWAKWTLQCYKNSGVQLYILRRQVLCGQAQCEIERRFGRMECTDSWKPENCKSGPRLVYPGG